MVKGLWGDNFSPKHKNISPGYTRQKNISNFTLTLEMLESGNVWYFYLIHCVSIQCLVYSHCINFDLIASQSENSTAVGVVKLWEQGLYLTERWWQKLLPQKVISLCVICNFVSCINPGMMTPWSCLSLKIHQRRRTWNTGWLLQWRNTQIHVRSSSADMVSTSGASHGKKLRPCEHLPGCLVYD